MRSAPNLTLAFSGTLLLALALMMLGHVCVLPIDRHGRITEADAGEGHEPQEPHDDGVHGASCEATPTVDNADAPDLAPLGTAAWTSPPRSTVSGQERIVVVGPPRFLLHAALLL